MSPIAFKGNPESATEFPVAPKGTYFLKVRNAQEKVSKTSGRNMIATEYVIAEGEYEGIHVFNYLTFIEDGAKGHGMTIHALKAHGLPWEGDVEISAADFEGIMVKADLDVETYDGKPKNIIKKFHLPRPTRKPERRRSPRKPRTRSRPSWRRSRRSARRSRRSRTQPSRPASPSLPPS